MSQALPLTDICVIEIGHSIAAPYAGQIFAHLGARVIKIENATTGDYARGWGPPFIEGAAALFHAMNNGKKVFAPISTTQRAWRVFAPLCLSMLML